MQSASPNGEKKKNQSIMSSSDPGPARPAKKKDHVIPISQAIQTSLSDDKAIDIIIDHFVESKEEALERKSIADDLLISEFKRFLDEESPARNRILHQIIAVLAVEQSLESSDALHFHFIEKIKSVIDFILKNGGNPLSLTPKGTVVSTYIANLASLKPNPNAQQFNDSIATEIKQINYFSSDNLINICLSYLPDPNEENVVKILKTVINFGAIITESHLEKLIEKGYKYTATVLRDYNRVPNQIQSPINVPRSEKKPLKIPPDFLSLYKQRTNKETLPILTTKITTMDHVQKPAAIKL